MWKYPRVGKWRKYVDTHANDDKADCNVIKCAHACVIYCVITGQYRKLSVSSAMEATDGLSMGVRRSPVQYSRDDIHLETECFMANCLCCESHTP